MRLYHLYPQVLFAYRRVPHYVVLNNNGRQTLAFARARSMHAAMLSLSKIHFCTGPHDYCSQMMFLGMHKLVILLASISHDYSTTDDRAYQSYHLVRCTA